MAAGVREFVLDDENVHELLKDGKSVCALLLDGNGVRLLDDEEVRFADLMPLIVRADILVNVAASVAILVGVVFGVADIDCGRVPVGAADSDTELEDFEEADASFDNDIVEDKLVVIDAVIEAVIVAVMVGDALVSRSKVGMETEVTPTTPGIIELSRALKPENAFRISCGDSDATLVRVTNDVMLSLTSLPTFIIML